MSATVRGKHSSGNRNRRADQQSQKRQLQRRRITLENDFPHRGLELEALPKISMNQLPQVTPILHVQGQIEPQCVTQLNQFPGCCALPEHLFDRIARHDVDH